MCGSSPSVGFSLVTFICVLQSIYYSKKMPLTRICPICYGSVNIKKSVCECGHYFAMRMSRKNSINAKSVRKSKRIAMQSKKALESACETTLRQSKDRERKAQKRALETECESWQRRQSDKTRKVISRALENECETLQRQQLNQARMTKKRALETYDEKMQKNAKNKAAMSKKRALCIPLDTAVSAFLDKTKLGPKYVCVSCNRMMYKQSVVLYCKAKYAKASNELLDQIFHSDNSYNSSDGKKWVCKTCDSALSRGNMPVQAKANGLQLSSIPTELSCLNALELRLISLRVPFMKMVALPSGKQRCIHGPAVNVPSKLDSICTMLPRLPSQSELIAVKLKRKLAYRGHYMYDFVSPGRVMNALVWLKSNNPLYANIEINDNWLQESLANDADLFAGLVEQPDTNDENSNIELKTHDHVLNDSDHVHTEPITNPTVGNNDLTAATNRLHALAKSNCFTVHDVPGDGNCLYNAIRYHLTSFDIAVNDISEFRNVVANNLEENGEFYRNFIAQPMATNNLQC